MRKRFVGNRQRDTHKAPDRRIESSTTNIVNLLWNKCQMVVAFGLLSLQGIACLRAQQRPQTVEHMAGLIDEQISEIEKSATPESAAEIPASLSAELDELKERSVMLFGKRRKMCDDNHRRFQG